MVTVLSNSILVTMRFVIAAAICCTGTTTKSHAYAFSYTQEGCGHTCVYYRYIVQSSPRQQNVCFVIIASVICASRHICRHR